MKFVSLSLWKFCIAGTWRGTRRGGSKRDSWPTVLFHRFNGVTVVESENEFYRCTCIIHGCILCYFFIFIHRTFTYNNNFWPFFYEFLFFFVSVSLFLRIAFTDAIKIYRRLNNICPKSIEFSSIVIENLYPLKNRISQFESFPIFYPTFTK